MLKYLKYEIGGFSMKLLVYFEYIVKFFGILLPLYIGLKNFRFSYKHPVYKEQISQLVKLKQYLVDFEYSRKYFNKHISPFLYRVEISILIPSKYLSRQLFILGLAVNNNDQPQAKAILDYISFLVEQDLDLLKYRVGYSSVTQQRKNTFFLMFSIAITFFVLILMANFLFHDSLLASYYSLFALLSTLSTYFIDQLVYAKPIQQIKSSLLEKIDIEYKQNIDWINNHDNTVKSL